MPKRILLVEGDYLQSDDIKRVLSARFPEARLDVCDTESRFREMLGDLILEPPDVIVQGIFLPWSHAGQCIPKPHAVSAQGFSLAGFRCLDLFLERGGKTSVILYTVLEPVDFLAVGRSVQTLPKNVRYVPKKADRTELINQILSLTA